MDATNLADAVEQAYAFVRASIRDTGLGGSIVVAARVVPGTNSAAISP
jgi:hypothetical protein